MTSHSNGMSTLQLQRHLGLGSYKSAWMLVHKIRQAMEVADGFPLVATVQAGETGVPYRLKGSEPPPGGRSHEGRLMIARAVESSVPVFLQFWSGMSRLGFGFDAPRSKPEA